MFMIISLIHKLVSVKNLNFAVNHMAMFSLEIQGNAKLSEFVAKGKKCGEPNTVNWKATETMLFEFIDLYANIALRRNKQISSISLNGKTS